MLKRLFRQKSSRFDTTLLAIVFGGLFVVSSFTFLDTLTMVIVIIAGTVLVLRLLVQLFGKSEE